MENAQIEQDNQELREILKYLPGGLIVYHWDGKQLKTLYISENYKKQYGSSLVSLGSNPGGPDFERVHPDDRDAYRAEVVRALNGPHTIEYVYRVWNEDAHRYLWTKMNGISRVQSDGTSIAYVIYDDVTAQQDALERERKLSSCLRLMTSQDDPEKNLEEVMKLVQKQYEADRVYIFEFDWENRLMSNTYEITAPNVSAEKENLQNLPVEIVSYWLKEFQKGEAVFIDNLEDLSDNVERKDEYEVLKPQGIVQLMTIPIIKNGILYGYTGVDNPNADRNDKEFLTSVAAILSQEFYNREQQKKLVEMSLKDPLSHVNNRHSFNQRIDAIRLEAPHGVGMIFADVNGLKYVNDNFGHREGDRLICLAAEVLKKYYSEEFLYRISGDEYVVMCENTSENEFTETVSKMKKEVGELYGSIFAIGMDWRENSEEISDMMRIAEERMYENKEQYYKKHPLEKRREIEPFLHLNGQKTS